MKTKFLLLVFLSVGALVYAQESDQALSLTVSSKNPDVTTDPCWQKEINRLAYLKSKVEKIHKEHNKNLLPGKIEHVVAKKLKKRYLTAAVRTFQTCAITTGLIMLSRYAFGNDDRLLHGLEGASMLGTTLSSAVLTKFLYDLRAKVLEKNVINSKFKAGVIGCAELGLAVYAAVNAESAYRCLKFAFTGA